LTADLHGQGAGRYCSGPCRGSPPSLGARLRDFAAAVGYSGRNGEGAAMWRRLGVVCEELENADEARTRELWRELDERLLHHGCWAAEEAGRETVPTLERCYERLSDPAIVARGKGVARGQEALTTRDASERIAETCAVLSALGCAAGQDDFSTLVRWAALLSSSEPPQVIAPFRAHVPASPFVWVRAAFGLLGP